MKEYTLNGTKREAVGKKASKEMRKQGLVPCNIYGENNVDGKPEAFAFSIPASEIRKVVYTPHIYVVNLNIDGKLHKAIIKELQFHPVTDALLHADFYEITEEKPIVIGIPVKLNGLAQGVREGGKIVTNLQLGKSIKVGDLHFEGLELITPAGVVVCSVKATRASRSAAAEAEENQ